MPNCFSRSVRETKALVLILVVYFAIVWLNFFFNLMVRDHPLDLFYALTFLGLLAFPLARVKEIKEGPLFQDRKDLLILLVYTVLYIISRYLKFPEMPVWLDEHTQFAFGNQFSDYSVIGHSIEEQQPALDYVLGGFAGTLFGLNAFAIKFHALLFTFLFGSTLPKAISFFSDSLITRWLPSFIILFSNPLLAYSLEGRPLMIALFFSLIYLIFLINFIKEGKDWGWLIVSQMLFIYTTGLQPQLFIFFTIIFSVGHLSLNKRGIDAFKLLSSGVICFLLHLPLLVFLIIGTKETNQFNHDFLSNFLLAIDFDSLRDIGEIYEQDKILVKFFGFFLVPSFLYVLFRRQYLKGIFLALPFVYLFSYFIIYKTFISWNFAIRYTFCVYSLYGLALGIVLTLLEKLKLRKLLYVGLATLVLYAGIQNTTNPINESILYIERPDWKGVYQYLNKEVTKEDYVVRVAFGVYGDWRGSIYVGDYIYANETLKSQLVRHAKKENWSFSNHFFYDINFDYEKSGRYLYVMTLPYSYNHVFRDLMTESVQEKLQYRLIDLYKIPIKGNLYETKKKYFKELVEKFRPYEHITPFYETLLMMELNYGKNKEDYENILENYRNIDIEGRHTLDGLIYPKRSVHYERVKFFEKAMREKWK